MEKGNQQWLATVAHELKSPLALIRQLALFSEQEVAADKNLKLYLRQIAMTSERALRLTSDLTRAQNLNQLALDLEPVDLLNVCQAVSDQMKNWYKIHHKNLVIKNHHRQYLAIGDFNLLQSILINFCDNALFYANQQQPVEIKIANHQRKIRLSVRDYGPKIPNNLWRAIKCADLAPQMVANRPQSSGLGLFIVNQFAEKMGAELGVISHQNGATFYIDLMPSKQLSLI